MYSCEIHSWLESKGYRLSSKEYLWLTEESGSVQINHIKYNPYSDDFTIWTKDGYE